MKVGNLLLLVCLVISSLSFSFHSEKEKIKGLTVVAPPKPLGDHIMGEVKATNAKWIAVVPYAFTRQGETAVHFDIPRQWWGEKLEGVEETIRKAKSEGLKVMLKPQVYIPRSWIGDLNFDTESEWLEWETNYTAYIDTLLSISEKHKVDLFCIGTECKQSIQQRPDYWRKLIAHARTKYSGQLTYSSNWDSYNMVPFWEDLDLIGVSAYFPLSDTKTPTVEELKNKWKPIVKRLKKFSKRNNRKILFTEFGYLSVDGCAYKAWELEKEVHKLAINETAQANAMHALFSSFWNQSFWSGGFLWKWFPDMQGHEGYPEKDYTPQGKSSENTIKLWYDK